MADFTYYTKETAPESAQGGLDKSIAEFGGIPNLHAVMAESPELLDGYHALWGLFKNSTLTALEQQVVYQTSNFENNCHYCVPGHTGLMMMQKMPQDVIDALRGGTPIADEKLQALREFTRLMVVNRGHAGDEALEAFLAAGYTKQNAFEVIVGLATKVMSNYTNAIAHTTLDPGMDKLAWTKPETVGA